MVEDRDEWFDVPEDRDSDDDFEHPEESSCESDADGDPEESDCESNANEASESDANSEDRDASDCGLDDDFDDAIRPREHQHKKRMRADLHPLAKKQKTDTGSRPNGLGDRIPRQRRSETYQARMEIQREVDAIENVLPLFPIRSCSEWETVFDAVDAYQQENNVLFRSRDTRLTSTYNKK